MDMIRQDILRIKKERLILLLVMSFYILVFSTLIYGSFYYNEDFSNGALFSNRWDMDFRCGREGIIVDNASSSTRIISGNKLVISGMPLTNDGSYSYHTVWIGRCVKLTNIFGKKTFTANEYEPFGFDIVRTSSRLWHGDSSGWPEDCGDINIWLIEENYVAESNWNQLDNFVFLYEGMKYVWGTSSRWGFYKGAENRCYLTNVLRPDNRTENLTTGPYNLEFDYSGGGINNNDVGIRITYDGKKIRFYINPDPYDNNAYPNEYLFLAETSFSITNNLRVMLGHENNGVYPSQDWNVSYTNFLIRTVCKNLTSRIAPRNVGIGSIVTYTNIIQASFSNTDAGIGELIIEKPLEFGKWSNIQVLTNDVPLTVLTTGTQVGINQVLVTTNGDMMKIRFLQNLPNTGGVIKSDTTVIKVIYTLAAPTNANPGAEFKTYADCVKYDYTGYTLWATTGKKKASPETPHSTYVKVYNHPQAFASITVSPTPVYEDNSGSQAYTYYYEFSTTGVTNAPDISKIIINFPAGVNISKSNVSSLLMLDDTNNIYVSNNQIILDYYNDIAGKLPSPNGYDRVTIIGYGTPDLPLNTLYSDYTWSSIVSSEDIVIGSSNQFTTTNSIYPSQKIRVIITSPEITCSIDITNGVGVPRISNETKTNTFIYSVYNTGTTKILKLKLVIPDVFTNGYDFSSDILGTNVNYVKASNILYLDYLSNGTNLPSGSTNNVDNIILHLVHNRDISDPVTNVDVIAYADNGNTEGWVIGTPTAVPGWSVEITPPDPTGESAINTNVIYTTLSTAWDTNVLYYTIYNNGAIGNNLGKAKIYIPSEFEILNVTSSHISNDATRISVSANVITLDYANDSNGVLKSYLEIPSEKDIVTLTLRHQISSPTNFLINCKVSNISKTNWADTTAYPGQTKTLTVEYPPVNAKYYVEVVSDPINNIIDSATTTNSITYVITNSGKIGNRILRGYIYIPLTISTNVINIQSSKINNDGSYVYYDKNTGIIHLNYIQDINGPLLGGEKDIITFDLIDYVTWEGLYTVIAKVSNDRECNSCMSYPGKLTNIRFEIPDAEASGGLGYKYIYTNSTPKEESFTFKVTNRGKGSNSLKKAKIIFPSLFWGKVKSIHSSYLGATSPQPYLIVQNSYAEILYDLAGNELVSSGTDIITITYTNDFADTNTVIWELNVDNGNGDGYVATGTITNMTKEMKIIVPVDVNISPTEVYTTSTNIEFTYIIHNGNSAKSVPVKKAKVYIPAPFSVSDIVSYTNTWTGTVLSIISNYILLDYSAANLAPGGQDVLTVTFNKISNSVTTNVIFDCKVNYGYISGFRDTITLPGNTNEVSVIFPPADALAYSEPNNVGKDIISSPYTIYVKNVAGAGNFIYQIRITPPAFVTNITSITSAYIGGHALYSNNMIILKYYKYGTNIAPLETDTINFIGMDSVNIVTQGEWQIEVNNTTNTNGYTSAAVYPGKSLALNLYQPSYNAYTYISPNLLDTTYITNQININVKNVSGDTSKINKVKIFIPSIFITNHIKISTTVTASFSVNASEIIVDYSASNNALLPNESDTITLNIVDTIDEGTTNTFWITAANYDSSGILFITNNVTPGKSITNYFYMPQPICSIGYNVEEIYTTTSNFNMIINVTNKGIGTHKIKTIEITVPQIFTNGFTVGDISSSIASNIQKTGNVVKLYYTNFLPSIDDVITLSILNTNKSISSASFTFVSSNGYKSSTNLLQVNITTPPSASITPQNVNSTAYSNNFTLLVKNDGSGVKSIGYAIVYLPAFITNIKNISSLQGASVIFTNNKLLLDYSAAPIVDGEYDSVTFTAFDSLTLEETNVIFEVSISNSFGNSVVSRDSTNNLKVSFTVPAPEAYAYLYNPLYVYTAQPTNVITIKITNYGTDLNALQKAVIEIPAGMQLVDFLYSSHLTNTNYIKSTTTSVTLYYANATNSLATHDVDLVSMKISHSFSDKTNVVFTVFGDNGKYLKQLTSTVDTTLLLKVKYPEAPSKFYVKSPEVLYTIDTNIWITFHIENSSYDNDILQLYITFYTDIFEVRKIDSEYTGSNNFYFVSNYLVIDYSAVSNLPTRVEEDIRINIVYSYSNATNFKFAGKAVFEGNLSKIALTNGGYQDTIPMVISDFGRIIGSVIPKGENVTVELLNLNNQNTTNKNGEFGQASINPTTGRYMIDFVLPGTYNLRFISEDFRITYYENVVVYSNKYTELPDIRLRNRLLNNDENTTRIIYADDEVSYVRFPVGSILEDFYLDIYKKLITSQQINAIRNNDTIINPASSSSINIFDFVLQDVGENDIDEIELNGTVTIVLHYTDAEIAAQGWSEDSLAIYYWKENTGEWVRLGGIVDKANNTVTVTVNYLHTTYAIFGSKSVDYTKMFGDLKIWPKAFTPGRGGDTYGKCKITFIFKSPVDEFKFRVYDLMGRLIYEKNYSQGTYYQAEISWDGKDNDGYYVKSGVYVYQIEVGDEYYRGTVMVVK